MNALRLFLVFFKGLIILIWLTISLGFGMWGYCEIVAMSRIKDLEISERKADSRFQRGVQQSQTVDAQTAKSSETLPNRLEYEYNGISFTNSADMMEFIYLENQANSIFAISLKKIKASEDGNISHSVIFIFTAISFGIIGTITQQIRSIIIRRREKNNAPRSTQMAHQKYILEQVSVLFRPVFGGLVGFMTYGITLLIPTILLNTSESTFVRPTTLLFFCFFGGLMSDQIYDIVTKIVLKLFEGEEKQLEKA